MNLNWLRVAFLSGVVTAILFTNCAAQVTAKSRKLVGVSPADVPVLLNIWAPREFYVFIWVAAGLAWVAMVVSLVLSFGIAGSLTKWRKEKQMAIPA